jgi:flagellar basal body-associated protein FliL
MEIGNRSDMRAILFILIIAVIVVLVAVGTRFLSFNQTRPAQAPQISATHNGIVAKGGQAPAFDVETGSVKVGTKDATVKVPVLQVQQPQNQSAATTNNAM